MISKQEPLGSRVFTTAILSLEPDSQVRESEMKFEMHILSENLYSSRFRYYNTQRRQTTLIFVQLRRTKSGYWEIWKIRTAGQKEKASEMRLTRVPLGGEKSRVFAVARAVHWLNTPRFWSQPSLTTRWLAPDPETLIAASPMAPPARIQRWLFPDPQLSAAADSLRRTHKNRKMRDS